MGSVVFSYLKLNLSDVPRIFHINEFDSYRNAWYSEENADKRGAIMENTGLRPEVIHAIKDLAQNYQIARVILFGSRARGDYRKTSDIDLAVSGGDITRFALDVEEETPTLLKYDIVNLDGPVQEELLASIAKEGKVLYEKI